MTFSLLSPKYAAVVEVDSYLSHITIIQGRVTQPLAELLAKIGQEDFVAKTFFPEPRTCNLTINRSFDILEVAESIALAIEKLDEGSVSRMIVEITPGTASKKIKAANFFVPEPILNGKDSLTI